MLVSKSTEEGSGAWWRGVWSFTQRYVEHVGHAYLDFVGPMLLLFAVNMAVDSTDKERFGLGWLHCASLPNDRVREEELPAHDPSSAAQHRRLEAAKAVEYASTTI